MLHFKENIERKLNKLNVSSKTKKEIIADIMGQENSIDNAKIRRPGLVDAQKREEVEKNV